MRWTNEATGKSIEIFNEDCMPALERMKENEFELAIVDPPYGINQGGEKNHTRGKLAISKDYNSFNDVESPPVMYFAQILANTNNQIMWGANHYISKIPHDSSCWLVWDKDNGESDFADCELAWTSFNSAVRKYKYRWQGMLQEHGGKRKEHRIHPTQKPVQPYKWLLKKYAKEGDKILDTHLGSGSIAIACWEMGFDLVGYEIDKDYFEATCKRLNEHFAQGTLFLE
jgi:site-specific DNA-methyltransferase (adenine-specific)